VRGAILPPSITNTQKLPQPDEFRNFLKSEEAGKLMEELAPIL
jgi:hypothetical protein